MLPDSYCFRRYWLAICNKKFIGLIHLFPLKSGNLRRVHAGKDREKHHFLFRVTHRVKRLFCLGQSEGEGRFAVHLWRLDQTDRVIAHEVPILLRVREDGADYVSNVLNSLD